MKRVELKNKSILEILFMVTKRYEFNIAMQYGERKMSYYELRERSVDISAELIRLGINDKDKIAILSENRPEWGVAFFGIISMAGITVPMDIKLSKSEIVFILNDSKSRCIFVSSSYLDVILQNKKDLPNLEYIFCFDEVKKDGVKWIGDMRYQKNEQRNRPESVNPQDIALIVYTSGTTGNSKGVELSYENLLFEVMAIYDLLKITSRDHFISILPLNHMLEITGGLIGPLWGGACITYCNSLKTTTIANLMQKNRVTVMICVPLILRMFHNSIMKQLSEVPEFKRKLFAFLLKISSFLNKFGIRSGKILFYPIHKKYGGNLRCFVCGGAPLDRDVEKNFWTMGFPVLQGYGLTETSPVISVNNFRNYRFGSVGKPLPGVDVKVIPNNESGTPEGEIIVKGPNVMKGYYKRFNLTKEVIKDDWFHTGDIGYIDSDGFLFISGRMKNLIVLGAGKKVFPEEVEEVMSKSPYIKEICVLGRVVKKGQRKGCEEVYGVIVPNIEQFEGQDRQNEIVLRKKISDEVNRLSQDMADYKKIRNFEIWDNELPKTSTRKIKRSQVIEQLEKSFDQIGLERDFIEIDDSSDNKYIKELRAIVANVVDCDENSIVLSSNLYADLGIDSLMKVEILVSLEKEKGINIPDRMVFEINTFGDLVKFSKEYQERVSTNGDDVRTQAKEIISENIKLRFAHYLSYSFLRAVFKVYFRRSVVGVKNIPPENSFIIAANHSSLLDFPIIMTSLPSPKVKNILAPAAKDYFYSRRTRKGVVKLLFNTFPFERLGDFIKGLKTCEELIRSGKSIILFPEGTRNVQGKLTAFKPGVGSLAYSLNIPVIPVYIHGAFSALPKGAIIPKPKKIIVHIGEPIHPDDLDFSKCKNEYEKYKYIADKVYKAVIRIKNKYEENYC